MKRTFNGWLFNRIEELGNEKFNLDLRYGATQHSINFLTQFVPKVGMQRKVKFTVETKEPPKIVKDYQRAKNYNQ